MLRPFVRNVEALGQRLPLLARLILPDPNHLDRRFLHCGAAQLRPFPEFGHQPLRDVEREVRHGYAFVASFVFEQAAQGRLIRTNPAVPCPLVA